MMMILFVGGLSWNTTDSELQQAFEACGNVAEAKVITDRETGRSRGFGFVTYEDEGSAGRAVEELNGSTLDGRTIRVDTANDRPRNDRGGSGGGGGGGRW
jgi:RNA recognition motif-containing protein